MVASIYSIGATWSVADLNIDDDDDDDNNESSPANIDNYADFEEKEE